MGARRGRLAQGGALGTTTWSRRPRGLATRTRFGPHICTGPLYVEGVAPGDTIARMIGVQLSAPDVQRSS
jgi:hypothetical protein